MAHYETVHEPIPFPEAFHETGDAAAQSQAAVLLSLGALLHYEEPTARGATPLAMAAPAERLEMIPEEDREVLHLPPELAGLRAVRGVRFDSFFLREELGRFEAGFAAAAPPEAQAERARAAMPRVAEALAESPEPLLAAELVEAGLSHPDPLVRVAAATSYADIGVLDQQGRSVQILAEGTYDDDPLVRNVAATALSRLVPGHPRLVELVQPSAPPPGGEPSRTGLLIHGTWARGYDWWQPGFPGNFHEYLKNNVDPSLYSASDRFDWSGGYSDAARALGGLDLVGWVQAHGLEGLDVFAHSHGASVAMLANRNGRLRMGRMVLLSCPVHVPKYEPDFSLVSKVVSIRVRMDLVILADRGGQRFRDPRIQEIVLPIWFKHGETHEASTWTAHNLAARI